MAPENNEAGRGCHLAPAQEFVSADDQKCSAEPSARQAAWLVERFGLSQIRAELLARLAFMVEARR
jgi:hypothetical protein